MGWEEMNLGFFGSNRMRLPNGQRDAEERVAHYNAMAATAGDDQAQGRLLYEIAALLVEIREELRAARGG